MPILKLAKFFWQKDASPDLICSQKLVLQQMHFYVDTETWLPYFMEEKMTEKM